tara:strand:+ start:1845 stop:2465 length:621 start_codon:yes stop_codon:yes gene_type:complete
MLVIDNFVSDEHLLSRINSPSTPSDKHFWCEDFPLYSGWSNGNVSCLIHEFIKYVFTDHRLLHLNTGVKYYEFWTNITHADKIDFCFGQKWAHPPHFDKDEGAFRYKNEYSFPKVGIIFYGCKNIDLVTGGDLYYWPNLTHKDVDFESESIPDGYETIEPRYNRLVILDSSKLHGVSKILSGKRTSIAVNLWEKEPYNNEDFSEED